MSVDDLYEWRQKFDKLQVKHWKTNIKQVKILSNHNIGPDSTGVFPRVIHGGSKSSDHV